MKFKKTFLLLLSITTIFILTACSNQTEYYFAQNTPNEASEWVNYVIVEKKGKRITNVKWSAYHIAGELAGNNYISKKDYNGQDKYTQAKNGIYMMTFDELSNGKKLSWDKQADLLINKLIDTQDYNDRIPVPSGASIDASDDKNDPNTKGFYGLVEKALASPKVAKGDYIDGYYYISLKDEAGSSNAPKYWDPIKNEVVTTANIEGENKVQTYTFGSFVVVNGTIVLAYYNSAYDGHLVEFEANSHKAVKYTHEGKTYPVIRTDKTSVITKTVTEETTNSTPNEDGSVTITKEIIVKETLTETLKTIKTLRKTKNQLGYSYLMETPNGPAAYEYFKASASAAKFVIEHQGFDDSLITSNGYADGVAGVTIHATDFQKIASKLPRK